jgi:phytoene synthase
MTLLTINDFLKIENIKELQIKKSNFRFAFYLLAQEKRIAISNFYLLCSYLDNIVDNDNIDDVEKQKRLVFWKNIIKKMYNCNTNIETLVLPLQPLAEVFKKYAIPYDLVETLIDGIGKDLERNRYNTLDELLKYCYGVASVVGLICMYIFTDNQLNENLKQYAINLGYALQLTNIIRDIGEDFRRNYVYIPQKLLTQFHYSEQDIANHTYNNNFKLLMNFLYEYAIHYYITADTFIFYEDKNILKSAEAMKNIYFKLLKKMKKNNFHIYKKKTRISNLEKLFILFTTK